ncbi:hypothetical protein RFI_40122, partial [Reticulomyxa filosa]
SNLLGIVELTQFQQFYHFDRVNLDTRNSNTDIRNSNVDEFISLPMEKIPRSSIVFNKDLTIFQKCACLCEKYVLPGSVHELNLSYKTRQRLVEDHKQLFSSKSIAECACIFDIVVQETTSLIFDSFWRFRQSNTFQEWSDKTFSNKN